MKKQVTNCLPIPIALQHQLTEVSILFLRLFADNLFPKKQSRDLIDFQTLFQRNFAAPIGMLYNKI